MLKVEEMCLPEAISVSNTSEEEATQLKGELVDALAEGEWDLETVQTRVNAEGDMFHTEVEVVLVCRCC